MCLRQDGWYFMSHASLEKEMVSMTSASPLAVILMSLLNQSTPIPQFKNMALSCQESTLASVVILTLSSSWPSARSVNRDAVPSSLLLGICTVASPLKCVCRLITLGQFPWLVLSNDEIAAGRHSDWHLVKPSRKSEQNWDSIGK